MRPHILTIETDLSFAIALLDDTMMTTIGEAVDHMSRLPHERRELAHWNIAARMLNIAMSQPAYLKAATLSLQTALALDGQVAWMHYP